MILALIYLLAADPVKVVNPNKVADFAEIESRIYRAEILENFEETEMDQVFEPQRTRAEVILATDFPAPVPESRRYASIRLLESDTRRVRLQFVKPPQVNGYCRNIVFWLNVEKPHARLSVIVEDRAGDRHFIDSGDLQFRGWRRLSLPVLQHIRQHDYFLSEKAALKIIGIELVFSKKYAKGKLPVVMIDEISAEVRKKYEIPPPLKK